MTKCQNTTLRAIEIDGSQLFKQGNGNAAPFFQRSVQGLGPIPTEFLFKKVRDVKIQNIQINAFDDQFGTLDAPGVLERITIGHNTMIASCDTSEKIYMPKTLNFQGPIARQLAFSSQIDFSRVQKLGISRVEESKEEIVNTILSRCKSLKTLLMVATKMPLNQLSALSGTSLRTLDQLQIRLMALPPQTFNVSPFAANARQQD